MSTYVSSFWNSKIKEGERRTLTIQEPEENRVVGTMEKLRRQEGQMRIEESRRTKKRKKKEQRMKKRKRDRKVKKMEKNKAEQGE